MKKSRLLVYAAVVGLCGAIFNTSQVSADPSATEIANSNLTGLSAARTFLKNNNPGYLTYIKGSKILYRINAVGDWNEISDSTDIAKANRGTGEHEQNGCTKILADDIYTFKVRFRSNYSGYDGGNCGNENANTNAELVYSGGRVSVDPPNGVPVAIFIRDIDSNNSDWQRIYFSKSAISFVYMPNNGAKFDYSNTDAYGKFSTIGNGLCDSETNPKCNALVLLSANSFHVKVMMKSLQGLMDINNDMTLDYRTLIFHPNGDGASVADNSGDGVLIRSYPSSGMVSRDYVQGNTAATFPNPRRDGYTFLGWSTSASGNCVVSHNCVYSQSMSSDVDLYAHWQPIPPPNVLSCGAGGFVGESLLVSSIHQFTASATGSSSPPIRIVATVSGPGYPANTFTDTTPTQNGNTARSTQSFTTSSTPGTYTLAWYAYDSSGASVGPCYGTSVIAGTRPYFEVKGADILAHIGGPSANDGIRSWNNDASIGSVSAYQGAGSQLAALTNGNLLSYVTGGANTTGTGPSRLAFANPAGGYSGSGYGGSLQSLSGIFNSPYTEALASVNTSDASRRYTGQPLTALSGVYYAAGDVTIPANTTVSSGAKVTIVVEEGHNVFIQGNIGYGGYSSITSIPRLNVYTSGGNIIVGTAATTIRGVFVAEGGGKFYSCGLNATTPITPGNALSISNYYGVCNAALTVYGSVSASELVLMRTTGSWHQSQGSAETFYQGPETWLSGGNDDHGFNNYISLPPIL